MGVAPNGAHDPAARTVTVPAWYLEALELLVRILIKTAHHPLHGPGPCPQQCARCRGEILIADGIRTLERIPRLQGPEPDAP